MLVAILQQFSMDICMSGWIHLFVSICVFLRMSVCVFKRT